jgi:hypothetical protein
MDILPLSCHTDRMNATQEGYSSSGEAVLQNLNQPPDTLPFTGFDAVLLVGAAVVLCVTGFVMRRFTRPE